MAYFIKTDPWKIIKEGWNPEHNEVFDNIFSIGSGCFGQHAGFEEKYSGDTLRDNYIGGIYFAEKNPNFGKVVGVPEYYERAINSFNWIGIDIEFDGEVLDLNICKEVKNFRQTLDMKRGVLERSFTAVLASNRVVKIHSSRFCRMSDDSIGAIRYTVTPVDFSGKISVTPYLDLPNAGDYWEPSEQNAERNWAAVALETKENGFDAERFRAGAAMAFDIFQNGDTADYKTFRIERENHAACRTEFEFSEGDEIVVLKYASVKISSSIAVTEIRNLCAESAKNARESGFEKLLNEQSKIWAERWEKSDVQIEGDPAAQQTIRFNLFRLFQNYSGKESWQSIGFTGNCAVGWEIDAFCLPFVLTSVGADAARNLLLYRHNGLKKAIENAERKGFEKGAALYPLKTLGGGECKTDQTLNLEEIHQNGVIIKAIYDYVNYTGDKKYLLDFGLEIIIAVARFWAQRIHWSARKEQFMIHCVAGPNKYESNVNNNWYTNYIAVWCLKYALETVDYVETVNEKRFEEISEKIKFYKYTEIKRWKQIVDNMYFPQGDKLDVFEQQDGFSDKKLRKVSDLKKEDLPLHEKMSRSEILRSSFVSQPDVLQGIYFFEQDFDEATIRRNFDYYEPMTTHESSISSAVHSVLASGIGKKEKAYELYTDAIRQGFDNMAERICLSSSATNWLAVVKGFGGLRVKNGELHFNPSLPEQWSSLTYKINRQGDILTINVSHEGGVSISSQTGNPLIVKVFGKEFEIA